MDMIQAISSPDIELDDEADDEEEVELDQVPQTRDNKAEIPDLPPLSPPGGTGIPSETVVNTSQDPILVDTQKDELPGTTQKLEGLAIGVALFAVGWMVIRWL